MPQVVIARPSVGSLNPFVMDEMEFLPRSNWICDSSALHEDSGILSDSLPDEVYFCRSKHQNCDDYHGIVGYVTWWSRVRGGESVWWPGCDSTLGWNDIHGMARGRTIASNRACGMSGRVRLEHNKRSMVVLGFAVLWLAYWLQEWADCTHKD